MHSIATHSKIMHTVDAWNCRGEPRVRDSQPGERLGERPAPTVRKPADETPNRQPDHKALISQRKVPQPALVTVVDSVREAAAARTCGAARTASRHHLDRAERGRNRLDLHCSSVCATRAPTRPSNAPTKPSIAYSPRWDASSSATNASTSPRVSPSRPPSCSPPRSPPSHPSPGGSSSRTSPGAPAAHLPPPAGRSAPSSPPCPSSPDPNSSTASSTNSPPATPFSSAEPKSTSHGAGPPPF